MQPNIPLGGRHNHTTLKVENNQSRRRPTSRSLSKLPVSGLYLKLFVRAGKHFSSCSVGNRRETKREGGASLFKLSSSLIFSFRFFPLPTELFGLKSSLESTFWPHVNTPLAPWITLITLSIYLGFLSNHVLPHVSYGSHLSSLFDKPCT